MKVFSMEKKNSYTVALLSSGLGHIKRGVETWTDDLGKELFARGYRVSVYKGAGKPDYPYEKVIGCLRRDLPANKFLVKIMPGFMWRFGFGSTYALEEMTYCLNILPEMIFKQFDIIHTQDPQVADFFRAAKKLGLIKSKTILAHGTEEPFNFLARFDYMQHLAPFHQQEMTQNGYTNKKSFAIGNFIDTDHFKPDVSSNLRKELNIPADAFVILSVAAIKKTHKRIDYLINEVSRIQGSQPYLVVAGSTGQETEELIKLGQQKLGRRMVFLKNFDHNRIAEVYAMADVFALCSLKEMMPIALLEAIASGLPAIIHRYPVEEWMIGEGGESIDMSKDGQLASSIPKYFHSDYKKQKSKKAREYALQNFSKDIILNKIIAMYEVVSND